MSPAPARQARTAALRRTLAALALPALACTALAAPTAYAAPADRGGPFPQTLPLPDGFQPEGIATRGNRAWLGSLADGDVYRLDLRTGEGERIAEGPGTASVGLEVGGGRLYVAGGDAGTARVLDARTGELLAAYQLVDGAAFVNDVVLTGDSAWFTDSQNPTLHQVPLDGTGDPAEVRRVTLGGDWEQVEGFNANGITQTPDGSGLLVVNSTSGLLYRVDPATGTAVEVDLGGASLVNGDGMLRQGRTLYVVQNRANQVAVLRLSPDGLSATKRRTITDPDFDVPTTIARVGKRLYLPNARFGTEPTPGTEYDVVKVGRDER